MSTLCVFVCLIQVEFFFFFLLHHSNLASASQVTTKAEEEAKAAWVECWCWSGAIRHLPRQVRI